VTHLEVRPEAAEDLEKAANWYEAQRPNLGAEFVDEARSQFLRVVENPLQFPIVFRDVRRVLMQRFPYAVYFRLTGNNALAIAVMDLRRKESRWQRRI